MCFTTGGPGAYPDDPDVPVATVTFTDRDGKTELAFEGYAPDAEADEIEGGWIGMFEQLDELASS